MEERFEHIERNPRICGGAPVFKGTRIPIHTVLDFLAAGDAVQTIVDNYPQLSRVHILEAVAYVSELTRYKEEELEISDWREYSTEAGRWDHERYPGSIYVLRSDLCGKSDQEIQAFSLKNSLVLITYDKDFLNILSYPLWGTPGRIVLRYRNLSIAEISGITLAHLRSVEKRAVDLKDKLLVFTKTRVRIRSKL